jgi:hypothetical protein
VSAQGIPVEFLFSGRLPECSSSGFGEVFFSCSRPRRALKELPEVVSNPAGNLPIPAQVLRKQMVLLSERKLSQSWVLAGTGHSLSQNRPLELNSSFINHEF